jgi:signal transduction histidine kinase/ActR/RegA family two-component response regulator
MIRPLNCDCPRVFHTSSFPSFVCTRSRNGSSKRPIPYFKDTMTKTTTESESTLDVETGNRESLSGELTTVGGNADDCQSVSSSSSTELFRVSQNVSAKVFLVLTILVGVFASSVFLSFGIITTGKEVDEHFIRRATELVKEIEGAWNDIETKALWLHDTCRPRDITRAQFREVFELISYNGMHFQAISCAYNITTDEREASEDEAREYFQEKNYSNVDYSGFTGLEPDPANPGSFTALPRSEQPFYFPVRFIEPIQGNEAAIDFDLYSSASRAETIEAALTNWKPTLTPRLHLVQETDPSAYSVILMHPGIPVSTDSTRRPKDLATLVIRIPDLLRASAVHYQSESIAVYIFDSSKAYDYQQFLGGVGVSVRDGWTTNTFFAETELSTLRSSNTKRIYEEALTVASSEWTIVVVPMAGTFEDELTFVILGAIMIFVACTCLAMFVYARRVAMITKNQMVSSTQAEKAALLVETAKASARAERELNDFIAHEVRNPLSAALSALSFVTFEVDTEPPLATAESRQSVQEDLSIIKNGLHFINDLLRSMLDMHRAASNQMKIVRAPTDLLKDVFEPVASMLYRRGEDFEVLLECPENLMVSADRLRLTQIVLNLGRNAAKFVTKGFVKLRAEVVEGNVHMFVEDSGPGIPESKRKILFSKFQESLDSLNQGTGIGLCLCKNLISLMEGEMWLDETYHSGVESCPGARFVINLNVPPLELDSRSLDAFENSAHYERGSIEYDPPDDGISEVSSETISSQVEEVKTEDLPETLSVLFIDDDLVLRKLFVRGIKRVQPGWDVQEAASGESALALLTIQDFDLIFVDQYMASMEKQLLGTETVAALRSKGCDSIICGLSANDVETAFLNAGADFFLSKPIPASKDGLAQVLRRVVFGKRLLKSKAVALEAALSPTETSRLE